MTTTQATNNNTVDCLDGIVWIENAFAQCVDSNLKLTGFIFGFLSLVLWLPMMAPQLWRNFRLKKCEMPLAFIIFWLCGDVCNTAGTFLADQQIFQRTVACWYLAQDSLVLSQYIYYMFIYPRWHPKEEKIANLQNVASSTADDIESGVISRPNKRSSASLIVKTKSVAGASVFQAAFVFAGILGGSWFIASTLFLDPEPIFSQLDGFLRIRHRRQMTQDRMKHDHFGVHVQGDGNAPIFLSAIDLVGYVLGIIAHACYSIGRIPQIVALCYAGSIEGISMLMFVMFISANSTYVVSILLSSTGRIYIIQHLPWLLGSFLNIVLDSVIVMQIIYRRQSGKNKW